MRQAIIFVTGELRDQSYHKYGNYLIGRVYNDVKGRWNDGKLIRTSSARAIYRYELLDIVVTQNSTYLLYHDQEWKDAQHQVPSEADSRREEVVGA